MTERYWVFAYYQYYPSGGLDDRKGKYEELESAKICMQEHVKSLDYDFAEVWDIVEDKQVCYMRKDH